MDGGSIPPSSTCFTIALTRASEDHAAHDQDAHNQHRNTQDA